MRPRPTSLVTISKLPRKCGCDATHRCEAGQRLYDAAQGAACMATSTGNYKLYQRARQEFMSHLSIDLATTVAEPMPHWTERHDVNLRTTKSAKTEEWDDAP